MYQWFLRSTLVAIEHYLTFWPMWFQRTLDPLLNYVRFLKPSTHYKKFLHEESHLYFAGDSPKCSWTTNQRCIYSHGLFTMCTHTPARLWMLLHAEAGGLKKMLRNPLDFMLNSMKKTMILSKKRIRIPSRQRKHHWSGEKTKYLT